MIRFLRVLGLAALGGAAIWLFTFGSFEQEVRMGLPGGFPMPDFRLPVLNAGLLEGDTTFVASDELDGKVVLLTFWATWCGPCKAEQPSLLALQDEFGDQGLRVLGVLHQDQPAGAWAWMEENGRRDLRTVVGTAPVARAAHVGGLPVTLLVDRSGQVVEVFGGYWAERDDYLRGRVRELLTS